MTKIRLTMLLMAFGLLLTGCETLRGVERDLQKGSAWFEDRVEQAR